MSSDILNNYEIRKAIFDENERIRVGKIESLKNTKSAYEKPDDVDLTPEQIEKIDKFWRKYSFIDEVNYKDFKVYYNRSGVFSPYYLPYYFNQFFLRPNLVSDNYQNAFHNKAYMNKLMPNAKQPKTVCRKVEGIYFDEQFKKITSTEAVDLCYERLQQGCEVILRPSGKSGGANVVLSAEATKEELKEVLKKKGRLFIVQEAIKQHPEMARLNPSTINTIRVTSLMLKSKVIPVAAFIKVGGASAELDNFKHNSVLLGVNMDGTVLPWGLNGNKEKVRELPSGINLENGDFATVPCWDSVIETVKRAHYDIPKMKLISWDVAIDDENEAEILECNYAGDLRMHQVLTGPVFGKYIGDVLDKYVLPKISKPGMNEEYDYLEFFDHIEITKYAGTAEYVKIPAKINGKPVTHIGEGAFQFNQLIRTVVFPKAVKKVKKDAFANCDVLEHIECDYENVKFSKGVVSYCPSMKKSMKKKIKG